VMTVMQIQRSMYFIRTPRVGGRLYAVRPLEKRNYAASPLQFVTWEWRSFQLL